MKSVYKLLYKRYGPQGWWPLTVNHVPIHYAGDPKTERHRFEIIIGAILTQNTNWRNVEKALHNLSKAGLLDIRRMCRARVDKIARLIRPAGYYNQKAERLKLIARYILKNYGSTVCFFDKKISELREELLGIRGIGPETADSIMLYSAEKPIFVIDAYTKRIFTRLGHKEKTYDSWQYMFMGSLKPDVQLFKEFHALIVQLAKSSCKNKPECRSCPLSSICSSKKTKKVSEK